MEGRNILNGLVPTLYRSLNTVARELVGATMAVTRDSRAEAVAVGQKIEFPIVPTASLRDVVPSANIPDVSGETIGKRTLEITQSKAADVIWTGNEQVALGGMYNRILEDQITERMRQLANSVEEDLLAVAVAEGLNAGNSIGTSGTTPFAGGLQELTATLKKLQDKGAPTSDLQAVLNTAASMSLRNLGQLQKINESGTPSLLRQGEIGQLMRFAIRESNGFKQHVKGTGDGYLVNGAASVGDIEIAIDTGSGTFVKGDLVTFGSDTTKYVVAENVASGGTKLKLVTPLQTAVSDNAAITIGDNYLASVAFPRSAIWLATRTVPVPQGGDKGIASRTITDPVSSLSFGVTLYPGYKQNQLEISLSWGVGVIKPDFVVPILG